MTVRKHIFYILSLVLMMLSSVLALGQTPFDAFAPETSRIILDADSIAVWRAAQRRDTILCAIVADLHNEQLLLVNLRTRSVLAHAPMTEDTKNWLSVDPLSDKYPNTSGYMYCNGNPVRYIDPDGRVLIMSNDICNLVENKNTKKLGEFLEKQCSDPIYIVAHGLVYPDMTPSGGISFDGQKINDKKSFDRLLTFQYPEWEQIVENRTFAIVVLLSCATGGGYPSFIQELSTEYPNILFVAPSNALWVYDDLKITIADYQTKTDSKGNTSFIKSPADSKPQDAWIFMYGGSNVNAMDPTTLPIFTRKKQQQKYEKHLTPCK